MPLSDDAAPIEVGTPGSEEHDHLGLASVSADEPNAFSNVTPMEFARKSVDQPTVEAPRS